MKFPRPIDRGFLLRVLLILDDSPSLELEDAIVRLFYRMDVVNRDDLATWTVLRLENVLVQQGTPEILQDEVIKCNLRNLVLYARTDYPIPDFMHEHIMDTLGANAYRIGIDQANAMLEDQSD